MSEEELLALARKGLKEAIRQAKSTGTPIPAHVLDDSLFGCELAAREGITDPLVLARATLPISLPSVDKCVLVYDGSVEPGNGEGAGTIVAMACDRQGGAGVVLAQRYLPKRWFLPLRAVGKPERLPDCENFVRAAFNGDPQQAGNQSRLSDFEEADLERRALEIVLKLEAHFPPAHRYRVVDANDYPQLDAAWYDGVRNALAGLGFEYLADVELESVSEVTRDNWFPTVVREMLSGDGQVCASAWKISTTPRGRMAQPDPPPTLDLETEFEDGSYVCTANVASDFPQPEWLVANVPSGEVSPEELVSSHRLRVQAHAIASGAAPRRVSNHEEFRACIQRLHARMSEFRASEAGISTALVTRYAQGNPRLAARIHQMRAQRRAQRP